MKQEYPKVLYARGERPRTVMNPDQHIALGPGWYESPADIPAEDAPTAPPAAIVPTPVTVETPAPETAAPPQDTPATPPPTDAPKGKGKGKGKGKTKTQTDAAPAAQ